MALRQRWHNSSIKFGSIDTASIQYKLESYNHLKPPMALYLADLFLGQSRSIYYSNIQAKLKQKLLSPAFCNIHYGPWLETLAQMQAALEAGDIDAFFTAAETFYSHSDEVISPFSSIAEQLTKEAAQLLGKDLEKIKTFMQGLVKKVDIPGRAVSLSNIVNWSGKLIQNCAAADQLIQALHLQCRLSICNHTGDVSEANQLWQQFLKVEPELYSFGADGLRVRSEMRNRRAVSLTDSFQYREAESILLNIISLQQDALQNISRAFGIDIKVIPSDELGACYGTLGQIYAFMGTKESFEFAEKSFRQAIDLFKEPADINRQWVYLGHLACDQGEAGIDLWREVMTHLPALGYKTPISDRGRQYELALQIKGLNVFGNIESKKDFCEMLDKATAGSNHTQDDFSSHPYGLIYQGLGILYQSLWHESKENPYYKKSAVTFFAGASKLMKGQPGLLNILGIAAQLRKEILELESNNNGLGAGQNISRLLKSFKESLVSLYSDNVWQESGNGKQDGHFGSFDPGPGHSWEERASAVLAGIRFNYW
jgi:tetratricopeptide (TPR) repeat protein